MNLQTLDNLIKKSKPITNMYKCGVCGGIINAYKKLESFICPVCNYKNNIIKGIINA